ncbi:S41 family peptidase [Ornithinimicrobium pekingense]|uniref:Tricorn protease homolog n=1 Tax=Ornithinimicrobium pekingense TaxID=384677 RepID=A0ABQ2FAZ4_9MICO|nr:S41 family peptidase [Ornithinimicrobium pekingense]GGK69883.1 tricorn protease [Ornithinimicrobium pekingense]
MENYLRYPHLHADLVTFVAADDVWIAPVGGGRAWRLTHDSVPAAFPRFSPDGAHVAFVSHRDGHPEAYAVPVTGDGSPRRLTWWGAKNTRLLGWDGPDRVLVASHAGQPNLRHLVVRSVGLDGSVRTPPYGPAWGVSVREDGVVALATPGSRPPAHWKRYRGGTAPRLWLGRGDGSGGLEWERVLRQDTAGLVDPMWVDGRLVFVSDRAAVFPGTAGEADRQADLWAFAVGEVTADSVPEQVTDQGPDLGYVRDATTDGHRVVWHSRGRLWVLDSLSATPREVRVSLPGAAATPYTLSPTDQLGALRPDHGGDASLVGWHGSVYWLAHREGPARALVAQDGVRAREPQLLGRTGRAVMVTDADGEDRLEVHDLESAAGVGPTVVVAAGRLARVLHLAADPAGERVALVSHDGAVRLVDLPARGSERSEGTVREVARSEQGEALSPGFSPDGRYLLWSQPTAGESELHRLMILDTRDPAAQARALTSGTFHDHDPAFTRDGRHVVFLSERTFDPDYDAHEFALSFSGSTRPWLLPLAADQAPPFGPTAQGWRLSGSKDDGRGGHHDGQGEPEDETPPVSPDLDLEGAEQRVVPFPVPSGRYRDLRVVKDGVIWVSEAGDTGVLGTRRAGVSGEPGCDTVELWSFPRRTVEVVVDKVDEVEVSGDGERLVVRHKDSVTVTPADHKPEDDDPAVVKVDLDRLRREVRPQELWRQMFEENGRIMRDHYWRPDMDGVDWEAVLDRWRPVVGAVATHDDLVDVLWETVAELNTSHAYVLPAEPPGSEIAERRLGLLGADLTRTAEGWRIERILPGESSEPEARSPLEAAGVGARVGDLVVAVDGAPVDTAYGPAPRLMGAAGKPVELTLRRDGADRRVVVVPLADEEVLRYQDWVRSRRDYVRERSGGRLGYVHVPDMTSYGWAQLHRDLRHASEREGLVVDVRYNRGGHTSQLVLSRLLAPAVGWAPARHYAVAGRYPATAPRGPVVLVANENSGSDGDIVNAAGQAMGVGPVVGVRTWGGVVGIDGRFDLVDGTSITQPRYAFWLKGKDWGVENHGVDPDIEVEHTPADFFGADDPQLDRAMAEAFRMLEERPAASAPDLPAPRVRR